MAKQIWKPGNMLYPLPAVMVSVADKEGNPNIITADGFDFRETRAVFLSHDR